MKKKREKRHRRNDRERIVFTLQCVQNERARCAMCVCSILVGCRHCAQLLFFTLKFCCDFCCRLLSTHYISYMFICLFGFCFIFSILFVRVAPMLDARTRIRIGCPLFMPFSFVGVVCMMRTCRTEGVTHVHWWCIQRAMHAYAMLVASKRPIQHHTPHTRIL